MILAAETYLENIIILKIIRLVPDIPGICVQIKLDVHQIDPVEKQGWDLGDTFSPYGPGTQSGGCCLLVPHSSKGDSSTLAAT